MQDPNLLPAGVSPQDAAAVHPLQAKTPEIPLEFASEYRAYVCTVSSGSMFRKDGKKIPFVLGVCYTNIKGDIDYLEQEIASGNSYIRVATKEEVEAYHMRINPRETIRSQVLAQEVPAIKEALRAELLEELKTKGVDVSKFLQEQAAEATAPATDETKIQGTAGKSAAQLLAARLGAGKGVMVSTPSPLQGIVGSDKIAAGAASGTVQS